MCPIKNIRHAVYWATKWCRHCPTSSSIIFNCKIHSQTQMSTRPFLLIMRRGAKIMSETWRFLRKTFSLNRCWLRDLRQQEGGALFSRVRGQWERGALSLRASGRILPQEHVQQPLPHRKSELKTKWGGGQAKIKKKYWKVKVLKIHRKEFSIWIWSLNKWKNKLELKNMIGKE